MSQSETNIFITGATGYIGGTVLSALLCHPRSHTFQITTLVRSPEKALLLNSVGVKTVVGSHSDVETLTSLASDADIAIACADSDDLDAARAILSGLKKRHEQTNKVPILIHTSGTGVLADEAAGNFIGDKIYSDLDIAMMESIPKTQPHHEAELEVIAADEQGYVRTYIISPSMIYGIANTALVSLGVQNPQSVQVPLLIKVSLDRGQGGVVGKGLNVWPNMHIDDVATLYTSVLDVAMQGTDAGHGRQGYYFGANGEHSVGELSEVIAKLLYEMGRGDSLEPTVFTEEELKKYFGGPWFGSNSRVRAERAKSIGWNPKHTIESLWASIKPEIEAIVERQKA